jgi:hypothetical protein
MPAEIDSGRYSTIAITQAVRAGYRVSENGTRVRGAGSSGMSWQNMTAIIKIRDSLPRGASIGGAMRRAGSRSGEDALGVEPTDGRAHPGIQATHGCRGDIPPRSRGSNRPKLDFVDSIWFFQLTRAAGRSRRRSPDAQRRACGDGAIAWRGRGVRRSGYGRGPRSLAGSAARARGPVRAADRVVEPMPSFGREIPG